MLIALGVFLACFAVFLLAPFYRRRAARLATDALRRSMPLTEAEIRADKDRLRAEHAIAIHKLEAKAEDSALSAARQMVEINRRDAAISALESKTAVMRTSLEEHENARRVLEQTITDRLPRVESRLSLAKKQLFQRDQEIATLTQSSNKYSQALEEATQINTQQRDEVHRLNATITTRAARNREPMGADARFDSEVALRAEIEALRAKARDQSALISRLQSSMVHGQNPFAHNSGLGFAAGGDQEVARLRDSLSEAEGALRAARSNAQPSGQPVSTASETELRALKSLNQDQQAEIARLKAALRSYEAEDADDRAVMDSKIAMKARLSSLQAQTDLHNATIHSLRAEIAAANEKLARQASQYMEEMRRLGAGSMPASGPGRRESYDAPASSLAARISAPRPITGTPAQAAAVLTTKLAQPAQASGAFAVSDPADASAPAAPATDSERVSSNFLRALTGAGAAPALEADAAIAQDRDAQALESASDATLAEAERPVAVRRRPGLLERLTNSEKPAASGG